tara:strand:- start:104 stop:514 length:411 start_codon:yes stop_codon:yes gene_type:complete
MIFFTFVYGYSQYFHEKHKDDPKKLYIPMEDKEGFKVGSQTERSTCNASASFTFGGDNSNVCLNGGNCIEKSDQNGSKTGIYNCKCIKPFSGDNCKINTGVRVDITDNFTSPTEIERIPMYKRDGQNYFIQDNDYL